MTPWYIRDPVHSACTICHITKSIESIRVEGTYLADRAPRSGWGRLWHRGPLCLPGSNR